MGRKRKTGEVQKEMFKGRHVRENKEVMKVRRREENKERDQR